MHDRLVDGSSTLRIRRDTARVEEITDVELFQIFVAVELLVIGVGDSFEFRFILRGKNRFRIATEIGACHRDDVRLVAGDELSQLAQSVIRITETW